MISFWQSVVWSRSASLDARQRPQPPAAGALHRGPARRWRRPRPTTSVSDNGVSYNRLVERSARKLASGHSGVGQRHHDDRDGHRQSSARTMGGRSNRGSSGACVTFQEVDQVRMRWFHAASTSNQTRGASGPLGGLTPAPGAHHPLDKWRTLGTSRHAQDGPGEASG